MVDWVKVWDYFDFLYIKNDTWEEQKTKIQTSFKYNNPDIKINWKEIWNSFHEWCDFRATWEEQSLKIQELVESKMDYKKIMDKPFNFTELYEDTLMQFCTIYLPNMNTAALKEKRKFGLEKYGEYSFQSNFENAMKSPVLEHAIEECIDLMNYLLHKMFVQNIKGGKDFLEYAGLLKRIGDVYVALKGKMEHENNI